MIPEKEGRFRARVVLFGAGMVHKEETPVSAGRSL